MEKPKFFYSIKKFGLSPKIFFFKLNFWNLGENKVSLKTTNLTLLDLTYMLLVTKTTTYEIAKNLDIGLKLLYFDHMSNFLFFVRPVPSCPNHVPCMFYL